MNYYMLQYTCIQYTYAHFHVSIANVLVFCVLIVFTQLYSTHFDMYFVYTCKFSVYEPMVQ